MIFWAVRPTRPRAIKIVHGSSINSFDVRTRGDSRWDRTMAMPDIAHHFPMPVAKSMASKSMCSYSWTHQDCCLDRKMSGLSRDRTFFEPDDEYRNSIIEQSQLKPFLFLIHYWIRSFSLSLIHHAYSTMPNRDLAANRLYGR